jgi:hypothetical protein
VLVVVTIVYIIGSGIADERDAAAGANYVDSWFFAGRHLVASSR